YSQISSAAWFDYNNDLSYSSQVLDDYVNKNISDSEALQSLMAVYLMAGRSEANILSVEPPAEYKNYHNYTYSAVEYFRLYLWNLAKFIETKYAPYGNEAQNYFNLSLEYRQKALDESVLVI
ncbi:MAG: hypothetical protein QUS09_06305, partial [Methanotrichaceae archaeon]|nr:hypothetical protein [Methanotrichaceae archaeon]